MKPAGSPRFLVKVILSAAIACALTIATADAQLSPVACCAEFDTGTNGVVSVPVRNELDMPVSLNGSAPIDVLLDTGADALLSTNIAHRLGLKLTWDVKLGGFGEASRTAARTTIDTVRIGGLVLHELTFVVLDPPLAGSEEFAVIGTPLLSQTVVRIDCDREQITFTDPKRFHYSGSAPSIPLTLRGNNATIPGKVDGFSGEFSIDTGGSWSMGVSDQDGVHLVAGDVASSSSGIAGKIGPLTFVPASCPAKPFTCTRCRR